MRQLPIMVPGLSKDPFLELAERFREVERTADDGAQGALAAAQAGLRQAMAKRESGDVAGALAGIRQAMQVLATMSGKVAGAEGATMHELARALRESLNGCDDVRKTIGPTERTGASRNEDR